MARGMLAVPMLTDAHRCSPMLTVRETGPSLQMSRLPWSEEWAWIKI